MGFAISLDDDIRVFAGDVGIAAVVE